MDSWSKGTAPGYDAEVIEGKGSLRAVWQAHIRPGGRAGAGARTGSRAPAASRTPPRALASTRVTCAWAALGHAVAAYDTALTYAEQRHQFGKPLSSDEIGLKAT